MVKGKQQTILARKIMEGSRGNETDRTSAGNDIPAAMTSSVCDGDVIQCVLCRSGKDFVSFDISSVKELIAVSELNISSLPSLKYPHLGLIRRCGVLIPVSLMSGIIRPSEDERVPGNGRVVIVSTVSAGKDVIFGVVLDEVVSVSPVEKSVFSDVSIKLAQGAGTVATVFSRMFLYKDCEYRHIDTALLFGALSKTIDRRSAVE